MFYVVLVKRVVFVKNKRNPSKFAGKVVSRNGENEFSIFRQNPRIHREKQIQQMEKWAKQAREKETLTLTISSARAVSRLFSFWPFD